METELRRLQEMDLLRTKAVVIVANKIDLARSRVIGTQGDIYICLSHPTHDTRAFPPPSLLTCTLQVVLPTVHTRKKLTNFYHDQSNNQETHPL